MPTLPAGAREVYENLRAEVLCDQARPEGVGAIVFHGMWVGLVVLAAASAAPVLSVRSAPVVPPPEVAHDRQLVRLLANMVLAAQSQVHYAY